MLSGVLSTLCRGPNTNRIVDDPPFVIVDKSRFHLLRGVACLQQLSLEVGIVRSQSTPTPILHHEFVYREDQWQRRSKHTATES
jgi:hypothetical protein